MYTSCMCGVFLQEIKGIKKLSLQALENKSFHSNKTKDKGNFW